MQLIFQKDISIDDNERAAFKQNSPFMGKGNGILFFKRCNFIGKELPGCIKCAT